MFLTSEKFLIELFQNWAVRDVLVWGQKTKLNWKGWLSGSLSNGSCAMGFCCVAGRNVQQSLDDYDGELSRMPIRCKLGRSSDDYCWDKNFFFFGKDRYEEGQKTANSQWANCLACLTAMYFVFGPCLFVSCMMSGMITCDWCVCTNHLVELWVDSSGLAPNPQKKSTLSNIL